MDYNSISDNIIFFSITGDVIPKCPPQGEIRFDKISFAYPSRSNVPILKDLNLTIPKSQVTAVVGPSGSGKSTLVSLILRLYDPDNGSIFLDNMKLNQLDINWLRTHVSIVSQVIKTFINEFKKAFKM